MKIKLCGHPQSSLSDSGCSVHTYKRINNIKIKRTLVLCYTQMWIILHGRCNSYLFIFEAFLQISVPQAGDVTYVLPGEPRNLGREVVREGQLDQLGPCGQDFGGILGRRGFFLQVRIGERLESRVRHPLEEVVQGGVLLQLTQAGRKYKASLTAINFAPVL